MPAKKKKAKKKKASGSVEDEAAWLRERVRSGALPEGHLQLASLLQYRAAHLALGEDRPPTLDPEELGESLLELGAEAAVRAIVAMFRQPLPGSTRPSLTRDRFTSGQQDPVEVPNWARKAIESHEGAQQEMFEARRGGDDEGAESIEDRAGDDEEQALDRAEREGGDSLRETLESAFRTAERRAQVGDVQARRAELPEWARGSASEFERLYRAWGASAGEDAEVDEKLWTLREEAVERARGEGRDIRRALEEVFVGITEVVENEEEGDAAHERGDEDGYTNEPHEGFLPFAPIVNALEAWCVEGAELPDLEVPTVAHLSRFQFHLAEAIAAVQEDGDPEEAVRQGLYDFDDHGFHPLWAIQRELVAWVLA